VIAGRVAPALLAVLAAACEDTSYRDIGAEITVLTQRTDALVPPARHRLAAFGRQAILQIEIALHTASPAGKVNLLGALGEIADPEAAPILAHFAVYDAEPPVRAACEEILARWARRGDAAGLSAAAGRALTRVADKRSRGEGPVVRAEPGRPAR
jgi:HEAT repeat protein